MENQKYMNVGQNVGGFLEPKENMISNMKPCDKIYASELNEDVSKSACSALKNVKFSQQFQSLSLPGSATLTLSNTDIIQNIIVYVQARVKYGSTQANNLFDLWELIQSVQYTIGGSTTFTVSGPALKAYQMLCMETMAKRTEVLKLSQADKQIATGQNASTLVESQIILNVPALTKLPSYVAKSLPFDARMLQNVSQVIIYFKSPSDAFPTKGNNQFLLVNGSGTQNDSLVSGKFIVVNNTWTDPSLSLGTVLRNDPMASYLQPHIFLQSFELSVANNSTTAPINVNLQGFRFGGLRGILFNVYDPDLWTGGNPDMSCELKDIVLQYNGVNLYVADGRSLLLIQTCEGLDLPAYSQKVQNGTINNYIYECQFSLRDAALENSAVEEGIAIGNNTLQLKFTPDTSNMATGASGLGNASATFGPKAVLQVCYLYNCAVAVSAQGARVDYLF